jgi:hypothetical protein
MAMSNPSFLLNFYDYSPAGGKIEEQVAAARLGLPLL